MIRSPLGIGRSIRDMVSVNYGTSRGWVRSLLANLEDAIGTTSEFSSFSAGSTGRLVFVCQGNICRSAFADLRARTLRLNSASVGLATNSGVSAFPLACETAAARGLDMSSHRTTAWADFEQQSGDLFLVMEIRQARRLVELNVSSKQIALLGAWARPRRIHLHDPHGLSSEYFQTCFALIDSAVRNLAIEFARDNSPASAAFQSGGDTALIRD